MLMEPGSRTLWAIYLSMSLLLAYPESTLTPVLSHRSTAVAISRRLGMAALQERTLAFRRLVKAQPISSAVMCLILWRSVMNRSIQRFQLTAMTSLRLAMRQTINAKTPLLPGVPRSQIQCSKAMLLLLAMPLSPTIRAAM